MAKPEDIGFGLIHSSARNIQLLFTGRCSSAKRNLETKDAERKQAKLLKQPHNFNRFELLKIFQATGFVGGRRLHSKEAQSMGRKLVMVSVVVAFCFLSMVSSSEAWFLGSNRGSRPERNVESFEKAGKDWGEQLRQEKRKPGAPLNDEFVTNLKDQDKIDYFNVHSELKEAFKKGFRLGFEDRIADLVLGPHLTGAAGRIGYDTSKQFVDVINAFENGWAGNIRHAIDVFIFLRSEGSQSDRETFIKNFTDTYQQKWKATQEILTSHGIMTQVSEGGTMLYLDYSKGKTLGALDIPQPEALKTEIYHQTFKVMGDEWGRRLSTNLIKRDELIDLLRRSKTALEEVKPGLAGNLGIIHDAFVKKDSYGTDAENVFISLIRAAGYQENPVSQVNNDPPKAKQQEYQAEAIIRTTPPKKKR